MSNLVTIYILFIMGGGASADIIFEPSCTREEVSIDTVDVEGTIYHIVSVTDFPLPMSGEYSEGLPSIPFTAQTFLLPPDIAIDTILITSASWDTLPGRYYLYPAQSGSMEDTTFALPDTEVYASEDPFPSQPVAVTRQGSAMGYSVVSFSGTPVRYIPSDSLLMVLTSVSLDIRTCRSEFERIAPVRETEWSASIRERGILSLVANPSAICLYQRPTILSHGERISPLNILDSPSLEGDGVDMLIITAGPNGSVPDLTSAFKELADYRTAQGIITIIRTVDWIDNLYSGCDIQEKIRNFIRDAHEQWGVQAVLLGGDDWIVPVREFTGGYSPSDDYYSDIDGDWSSFSLINWLPPDDDHYVDLILGRWPVDNADDVELLLSKLKLYEWPDVFPKNFARKMLFIGGSYKDIDGYGAAYEEFLKEQLENMGISGPAGNNLDEITELFFPQIGYYTPSGSSPLPEPDPYHFESDDPLNRNNALSELNSGYNLIIHMDHSGTHEIGAAQQAGEYLYEFDFQSLSNTGEPSILWTAGCWPGHFEGADCYAEAGLLTSDETGLVAVIANARNGFWEDWKIYYPFIDALYPFGWITNFINLQPVSYIGEAYRYSMNFENDIYMPMVPNNYHRCKQHLFGDPTMYVWRDDPHQLAIEAFPLSIFAGISADITVSVTDSDDSNEPIAAIVCFYKDGDIFAIRYTDEIYGMVTLHDVEIAHRGQITVTAVKRREYMSTEPVVCNFIPAETSISVFGSSDALVNLEGFTIDDDNLGQSEGNGDGVANPGEIIELDLNVKNLGMSAATHLRAQLTVVSGDVQIDDDFKAIGYLAGGASLEVQNAFVVSIPDYLDENEPVQMQVGFIYDGGSWESTCDFTVLVDDIELALHSIDVEYDSIEDITTVEISNILAVNTGIGAAEDVEITLNNFNHSAVFTADVSMVGDIAPGTSSEAPSLFVECEDPPNEWKNPNEDYFHECMFHIVVTDKWGREFRDTISVSDYNPKFRPIESEGLEVVEAGQDYINVEWFGACLHGDFYLYEKEEGYSIWNRSNLFPMPVWKYSYSGLEPSTQYDLAVTAVDEYGQESSLCEMENPASTVCTVVDGWPIQLQGNPGSGPVSVNMDEDEDEEIVAVSSFGMVYIINRDGSTETIPPPVALDYDRYVSCAVGDVDNDSEEEIVVSYQVNISDGIAGLLIYDRDAFGNWDAVVVDDNIGPVESVCAAMISGTPVLLQANSSPTLEIALRTKGDNSLYLWELDNENGNWEMYDDFPVDLNCFFTPPVAVDYDEDGYDELLVTDLVNGKSQIHIVDFTSTGFTESYIDLSVYLGDSARVYSSLAAVEWNGDYYLAGVAKRIDTGGSDIKKVFVCNLTGGPFPYMEWWHHDWETGYDFYGNMGAPAIGQLDSDNEPEVAYTLEGMCGWNLLSSGNGYPGPVWTENAGEMAESPYREWDESAKSATIIGGTTAQGSDTQVTFTGFSTLNYGHDPQDDMIVLPGFPAWSEDACFTAPLIVDLDNDEQMECLTTDASGLLTLYEWEGYSTSSGGWPMYQHDPWRTGYYNKQFSDGEKLDLYLVGVEEVNLEIRRGANVSRTLLAEVEVTGSGVSAPVVADVRPSSISITSTPQAVQDNNSLSAVSVRTSDIKIQQVGQPSAVIIGNDYDTVKIALFSGNRELSSSEFPLYDGTQVIELAVPSGEEFNSDALVVRVDPGNEYPETAEDNNYKVAGNLAVSSPSITRVYLQSPCESIVLNINLMEAVPGGISIRAYSIDGRLVVEKELIELDSGSYAIELLNSNILPAGIYTVVVEGINEEELIRRVVVLP